MTNKKFDLIVIGGGAAGFFAAINAKIAAPHLTVAILEKNAALLTKVKVSGGGRCNVTHNCFDPKALVKNYPRGYQELLGPFHQFAPKETILWFEKRNIFLKTESDGRIFPTTDSSSTIIDCFLNETKTRGIEIFTQQKIEEVSYENSHFSIKIKDQIPFRSSYLILATGSSSAGHDWAERFGHTITKPVPSLFTFNIPSSPLKELSGVALTECQISIVDSKFSSKGALLITHFGFSGPAILKLSAWAARLLHEKNYLFQIKINWLGEISTEEAFEKLKRLKEQSSQKSLINENVFGLPKSLWKKMIEFLQEKRLSDISLKNLHFLANKLTQDLYNIEGKTTHKEEFVTCGGITLKEVDFKRMESKMQPHLYFAGEILDIDGVTGGFNFQNAWTTGFIAAASIAQAEQKK